MEFALPSAGIAEGTLQAMPPDQMMGDTAHEHADAGGSSNEAEGRGTKRPACGASSGAGPSLGAGAGERTSGTAGAAVTDVRHGDGAAASSAVQDDGVGGNGGHEPGGYSAKKPRMAQAPWVVEMQRKQEVHLQQLQEQQGQGSQGQGQQGQCQDGKDGQGQAQQAVPPCPATAQAAAVGPRRSGSYSMRHKDDDEGSEVALVPYSDSDGERDDE